MQTQVLSGVRIVLVEPAGERNIGAIARVMKNMGLYQLVLVNPQCDPLSTDAREMAVHGVDVLENAQIVDTMTQALVGVKRAIATTARDRALPTTLEHPRIALPWLLQAPQTSALIFGPENRGLSNAELNYAQRFVQIPANPEYSALNLAQAVGICCYELYQATSAVFSSPSASMVAPAPTTAETEVAPLEALEGYYQQLESVLLKIGYLYPHTASSRMEKFRRLFNRCGASDAEIGMLRGILSQMEWAIKFLPQETRIENADSNRESL